ncbi:hypothetical protein BD626DRAFT_569186 [Schizophyllum amplum]|uniref:6-phosphogluconate dehydrogenase NADP-binding domain-containing protein n=1 Tax=Schizophyllum amplum TaxID=97359 RepID=A0A550CEB3_9AGAR|nr:hypothetical protein BD626DRAFT_569186 [Auriculariopsis ampla]
MDKLNVTQTQVPFSRPASPERNLAIGWVGLGNMGYLMARNFAKSRSNGLLVWNRTTSKAEDLQKEVGSNVVSIAKDLTEIVEKCDVIFTSLSEDTIVKSVYEKFAEVLKSKPTSSAKIFVETSTTFPTLAPQLDDLITALPHCHFVTSPLHFADKSGIDPSNVLTFVEEILPAPSMVGYANRMAHKNFDGTTGFSINGGIKDASHMRHLSSANDVPLPAIDVAYQHLLTARAIHQSARQAGTANFDVLDWSGMIAGVRVAAGLAHSTAPRYNPVQEKSD